ncbi:MAG: IS110 family transposase [Candidatus Aminicenantaceae bacterium]
MIYYGAADVHSSNTCLGIIDDSGRKVIRTKVLNYPKLILHELEPFREKLQGMVVESTFNWYWIVDAMMEAGYKVHLANPAAVKQYEGLKHTNDFGDAFHLANLLRLGILPEGYIFPKEQRALRDLLRKRLMLVRHRTAHILSFQSLYCRQTGFQLRGSDVQRFRDHEFEEISPFEHVQLAGQANILTMRFLASLINEIEKKVLSFMTLQPQFIKLKTVTGIGNILGLTIALETGDISRFPKVGNYASYCRMVSSQHLSNDKKKGQGNRKNGNKYLCWAFIEAANFALRYCPHAKRFHQRKMAKTKKVIATKALAHKLARAAYFVMRDHVDYDPQKLFA